MLHQAGSCIVEAEYGVEALERMAEQYFALVLMDIRMPRMNGAKKQSYKTPAKKHNDDHQSGPKRRAG